ncbi:hypothetical protein Tco_1179062 [Tanacetum coccineum]
MSMLVVKAGYEGRPMSGIPNGRRSCSECYFQKFLRLGQLSSGVAKTGSASLGASTTQISSPGPSTPPSDSPELSRNAKCSK